jgi:hypothetical protein
MFQLLKKEWSELITICDNIPKNIKYSPATPFAFTEQGVAMLSSILNSERAIQVNVIIIRTFVLLRQYAISYKELHDKILKLDKKYNKNFKAIFKALDSLIEEKQAQKQFAERERIGFKK